MVLALDDNTLFFSERRFIRKLKLSTGEYFEVYDDHRHLINSLALADPFINKQYWSDELDNGVVTDENGTKIMNADEQKIKIQMQLEKIEIRTNSSQSFTQDLNMVSPNDENQKKRGIHSMVDNGDFNG